MTDPKSRVQLALELAALAWHGDEANALAKSIMAGGIHNIAIALANVLLHLVDEQATVHPIAGGQLGDSPLRVSCPPADAFATEDKPLTTMSYGGLCQCAHSSDHSVPHEQGCVGYRSPASSPSEDKPLTTMPRDHDHGLPPRTVITETDTEDCGECVLISAGCKRAAHAEAEFDEAQAELTRIKTEYADLKSHHDQMVDALTRNPSEAKKEHDAAVGTIELIVKQLGQKAADGERAIEEFTRIKADNERLRGELLSAVTQERHQRAIKHATSQFNKLKRVRLEVRRMNKALRVAGLAAREQASRILLDDSTHESARKMFVAKLAEAERTIAELKTGLAWERGWDLCRKAQMGAVVEAARVWAKGQRSYLEDMQTASLSPPRIRVLLGGIDELDKILSALDRTEGEQPTTPELPDTSAEAPRAIKLHSTWRRKSDGEVGTIWRVYPDGSKVSWQDSRGYGRPHEVAVFRERFEWVSDASLASEVSGNSGSGSDDGA